MALCISVSCWGRSGYFRKSHASFSEVSSTWKGFGGFVELAGPRGAADSAGEEERRPGDWDGSGSGG